MNGAEHPNYFYQKNCYYFIVHYFCSKVSYIDTKIIANVIAKIIDYDHTILTTIQFIIIINTTITSHKKY